MLEIIPFPKEKQDDMRTLTVLSDLWEEAFKSYNDDNPLDEVRECLAPDRLAFLAVEGEYLAGFAGVIPQYGVTGWELHPLMVAQAYQGRGVGSKLLQAVEDAVRERGGITLYLGSDDIDGSTSLANCDLYNDLWDKIKNIQTLVSERHPYEFYLRHGYTITGVTPDANGLGKPDIWMAKKLV